MSRSDWARGADLARCLARFIVWFVKKPGSLLRISNRLRTRVRRARRSAGLTQEEMATIIGMKYSTYRRFEGADEPLGGHGKLVSVSFWTVVKLCYALNLDLGDLVGDIYQSGGEDAQPDEAAKEAGGA